MPPGRAVPQVKPARQQHGTPTLGHLAGLEAGRPARRLGLNSVAYHAHFTMKIMSCSVGESLSAGWDPGLCSGKDNTISFGIGKQTYGPKQSSCTWRPFKQQRAPQQVQPPETRSLQLAACLLGFGKAALHTSTRRAPAGCSGHPLWQRRCCCRVEVVSLSNGSPSLRMTGPGQRSHPTIAGSSARARAPCGICCLTLVLKPPPSR